MRIPIVFVLLFLTVLMRIRVKQSVYLDRSRLENCLNLCKSVWTVLMRIRVKQSVFYLFVSDIYIYIYNINQCTVSTYMKNVLRIPTVFF